MRTIVAVLAVIAMLGIAGPVSAKGSSVAKGSSGARGSSGATCAVTPSTAAAGTLIRVDISGITQHMVPYGWFVVYDTGPTTVQAVSSADEGPVNGVYGDNGSYTVFWDEAAGTGEFYFVVQPDPGPHVVQATYRKIFATCTYDAT